MKNFLKVTGISLLLTFVLPIIVVKTVSADAGMAVCFILFFAVNPVTSSIIGVFAGKNISKNWWVTLIFPIIFLISSVIIFALDTAFAGYAAAYLVLAALSMAVIAIIKFWQ